MAFSKSKFKEKYGFAKEGVEIPSRETNWSTRVQDRIAGGEYTGPSTREDVLRMEARQETGRDIGSPTQRPTRNTLLDSARSILGTRPSVGLGSQALSVPDVRQARTPTGTNRFLDAVTLPKTTGLGSQSMEAGGLEPIRREEQLPFQSPDLSLQGYGSYATTSPVMPENFSDVRSPLTLAEEALGASRPYEDVRRDAFQRAAESRKGRPVLSSFLEGLATVGGATSTLQAPFKNIIEEQRRTEEPVISPLGMDIGPSQLAQGAGTALGMLGNYALAGGATRQIGALDDIANPILREVATEGTKDILARGLPNYLERRGEGMTNREALGQLPQDIALDAAINAGFYGVGRGLSRLTPLKQEDLITEGLGRLGRETDMMPELPTSRVATQGPLPYDRTSTRGMLQGGAGEATEMQAREGIQEPVLDANVFKQRTMPTYISENYTIPDTPTGNVIKQAKEKTLQEVGEIPTTFKTQPVEIAKFPKTIERIKVADSTNSKIVTEELGKIKNLGGDIDKTAKYVESVMNSSYTEEVVRQIRDDFKFLERSNDLDRLLKNNAPESVSSPLIEKHFALNGAETNFRVSLLDGIINEFEKLSGPRSNQLVTELNEKLIDFEQVVKEVGPEEAARIQEVGNYMRQFYDSLGKMYNGFASENGLIKLNMRENYMHHYRPEKGRVKKFSDLLNNIKFLKESEPKMEAEPIGFSRNPAGIAMEQTKEGYGVDAFESAVDYVERLSLLIHSQPLAKELDVLRIQAEAEGKKNFAKALNNHIESLVGEASSFSPLPLGDNSNKALAKSLREHPRAGKWWAVAKTGNDLANSSAILLKGTTTVMQVWNNVPAMAKIAAEEGGIDSIRRGLGMSAQAMTESLGSKLGIVKNTDMLDLYKRSNLIPVRRQNEVYSKMADGIMENVTMKAGDFLEMADTAATTNIWNMNYAHGLRLFGETKEGVEKAIKFADRQAKEAAGGRAIGDLSLTQQNALVKFILPFTLEVENNVRFFADYFKENPKLAKQMKFMLAYSSLAHLTDTILGRSGFSPLTPVSDLVSQHITDNQDPDVEKLFNDMGLMEKTYYLSENMDMVANAFKDPQLYKQLFGREIGQVLSNVPGGAFVGATLIPEFAPGGFKREDFFGEDDPTMYGVGTTPFINAMGNVIRTGAGGLNLIDQALTGEEIMEGETPEEYRARTQASEEKFEQTKRDVARGALEAGFDFLPIGGAVERAYEGGETMGLLPRVGSEYDRQAGYMFGGDELVAVPEITPQNVARSVLFGSSSLDEAEKFFREEMTPLSEKQTDEFFKFVNSDERYFGKTGKEIMEESNITPAELFDAIVNLKQGRTPSKREAMQEFERLGIKSQNVRNKLYERLW